MKTACIEVASKVNVLVGNYVRYVMGAKGITKKGSLNQKALNKYGFHWDELYSWKSEIKGSQQHIDGMIDVVVGLLGDMSESEFHTELLLPAIARAQEKFDKLEKEREDLLSQFAHEPWAAHRLRDIKKLKRAKKRNAKSSEGLLGARLSSERIANKSKFASFKHE